MQRYSTRLETSPWHGYKLEGSVAYDWRVMLVAYVRHKYHLLLGNNPIISLQHLFFLN